MTRAVAQAAGWVGFVRKAAVRLGDRGRGTRLLFAVDDTATFEVVGGDFDHDAIAGNDADEVFSHFAGDVGHHLMTVFQFDAELSICKCFDDIAFDLNRFFLRHSTDFFHPLADG